MPTKGDGSSFEHVALPLSLFSLADLKLRWKGSSNTFAASYLVQKKSSIGPMGGWVVVYLHMWLTLLCNIPPWRFGRWSHIRRWNHTHIGAFSRFFPFSILYVLYYYTLQRHFAFDLFSKQFHRRKWVLTITPWKPLKPDPASHTYIEPNISKAG